MPDSQTDNQAVIAAVLTADKQREFDEVKSTLDILRQTRKARGGVGAPLEVPRNLKAASKGMGIIITDADLRNDTPLPGLLTNPLEGVSDHEDD